jgi:DNA-binding response OmpR family regulator
MKYKILYAEDEPFLAQIVSDNLTGKGFEVLRAADGQTALQLFKTANPDLCVLDIMMPLKDGYSLATDIRKINMEIPIIFVSAKSLEDDVVKGFKSGGNDYMRKPFSVIELIVRIEALLNRAGNQNAESQPLKIAFGNSVLDTLSQQLQTPEATYDLSYREAALLELLLKYRNNVLERQEALLKIWGNDTTYNTNSMNVFMTHIRKLVRDDPDVQIMSIRGIGYKLVC